MQTQLLTDIQGLIILVNMFLAFIASLLLMIGWHMTGVRPGCRAEVVVACRVSPLLARIERAMNQDASRVELARGPVLPNGRAYMAGDETFRLPKGVVLNEGRMVFLSTGVV